MGALTVDIVKKEKINPILPGGQNTPPPVFSPPS